MLERKVVKGIWFLPDNTDREITGTLTCDPDTGINLEIEEPFIDKGKIFSEEVDTYNIILGYSREGDPITLYNCFITGTSWGNSYSAEWHADYAFFGCHATRKDALNFNRVSVRASPLFMWLNSTGIKLDKFVMDDEPVVFTYKRPDSIILPINDKVYGKIDFTHSYSAPASYAESIKLSHSATLTILTTDENALFHEDLWKYAKRFFDWLTIVTGYSPQIESENFYHNELVDRELDEHTKYYTRIARYSKKYSGNKQPTNPRDFLFDYPKVKDLLPDIVTKWYALFDDLEIILYILAENMGRDGAFSEFHFKDIIQALESFHRKRVRNARMPKADYTAFKKKILSQILDEEDRIFVKERLNYGNEPSLRERLNELIERCEIPSVDQIIGNRDEFIRLVVDNRNYLTHLDSTGKKTILTPTELYHLSEKALSLLFVTIMNEVIEDKTFVDQIIRKSRRWRFRINSSDI